MLAKAKEVIKGIPRKAAFPAALAVASGVYALPAYASESPSGGLNSFDPSAELLSGFTATANTVLATMTACLPVIMSVMSAYICIRFGLRFFQKFVR